MLAGIGLVERAVESTIAKYGFRGLLSLMYATHHLPQLPRVLMASRAAIDEANAVLENQLQAVGL